MKCLNCNEVLVQNPKKREKQFCDSTCRSNFWQKKKRLEKMGYGMPVDPFNKIKVEEMKESKTMPEGLHWKEQLEWVRNHKKSKI